jgi:hypothetical protein
MSDEQPQNAPAPAAIPWYHAAVLRGILVCFFTQTLAIINRKYHVDLSVWGFDVNTCTEVALDGISYLALTYAFHGRTVKPLPQVTLNKPQADAINAAAAEGAPPFSVQPPTKGPSP